MTKKSFATYFGLVALALSLFASTAFASTATSINVKDVDAPGRKPFQTTGAVNVYATAQSLTYQSVVTVPANQRLIVNQVSGICSSVNVTGSYVALSSNTQGQNDAGLQFMSKDFTVDFTPANAAIEFFANPGEDFGIKVYNAGAQDGFCYFTISGYFVNLP